MNAKLDRQSLYRTLQNDKCVCFSVKSSCNESSSALLQLIGETKVPFEKRSEMASIEKTKKPKSYPPEFNQKVDLNRINKGVMQKSV